MATRTFNRIKFKLLLPRLSMEGAKSVIKCSAAYNNCDRELQPIGLVLEGKETTKTASLSNNNVILLSDSCKRKQMTFELDFVREQDLVKAKDIIICVYDISDNITVYVHYKYNADKMWELKDVEDLPGKLIREAFQISVKPRREKYSKIYVVDNRRNQGGKGKSKHQNTDTVFDFGQPQPEDMPRIKDKTDLVSDEVFDFGVLGGGISGNNSHKGNDPFAGLYDSSVCSKEVKFEVEDNDDMPETYDESLEISIDRHEISGYEGGKHGVTIFFKIKNITTEDASISVVNTYVLNNNNEQYRKDYNLTGFDLGKVKIKPGCACIGGHIFLDTVAGKIADGWMFCVEVDDNTNGIKYNCKFKLINESNMQWNLQNIEKKYITRFGSVSEKSKVLTSTIERLELSEQNNGIRFENLSVFVKKDFSGIVVMADVYAEIGGAIPKNLQICVNYYDKHGKIINLQSTTLYSSKFMGYDAVSIEVSKKEIALDTEKIRIFVKE